MGLCILNLSLLFWDSIQKDWCMLSLFKLLYVFCSCFAYQILDLSICFRKVFMYTISFKGLMIFFVCVCFQAPKCLCGPDLNCSGTPAVQLSSLSSGSSNKKSKQMSCQCSSGLNSVLICHVRAVWLKASEPHAVVVFTLGRWSSTWKSCQIG